MAPRDSTADPALAVDVAVVGAGTAGLAAYRAAVAHTPRVVVIEGGAHGSTCARVGCMPSKLLIAAAEVAHGARHAAPFGVRATAVVDGRAVMDRVRRERDRFVGFVVAGVEKIPAEHRLTGWARFVAPGVLDVSGRRVEAKAVVLATGSSPSVPPMFADLGHRLVVNDDVFAWETLPASVAVFGTGVIGLELGQALHRLGVRVRMFGKGGNLAGLTDPVVKLAAEKALAAELSLLPDAEILGVTRHGAQVVVEHRDGGAVHRETFDYALVATGRRPNLDRLALENAAPGRLERDARGAPVVDRRTLQWGAGPLFVAGDAEADLPVLHEAADEGTTAGENAAHFPDVVPGPRRTPLAITFTDPQIASVGTPFRALAQALQAGDAVAGHVSFEDQGRSRVMLQNRGALRVYADTATGRLLGAEVAGPRAEHLAHLLSWAHQQGLTIARMLSMPFYHPVVEEGLRTALRDAQSQLAQLAAPT